jgi:acetyl esterase/lipase
MATSPQATEAQWDVARAVRWLRADTVEYGVDPTRIFAMGASAGGITAQRLNHNAADWQSRVGAGISMWGGIATSMIEAGNPPSLFFHGLADQVLDASLSRNACQRTLDLGNICRGVWWPDEGHSAWHRTDEIVNDTVWFLNRHNLL